MHVLSHCTFQLMQGYGCPSSSSRPQATSMRLELLGHWRCEERIDKTLNIDTKWSGTKSPEYINHPIVLEWNVNHMTRSIHCYWQLSFIIWRQMPCLKTSPFQWNKLSISWSWAWLVLLCLYLLLPYIISCQKKVLCKALWLPLISYLRPRYFYVFGHCRMEGECKDNQPSDLNTL